jgi:hypothetical protein
MKRPLGNFSGGSAPVRPAAFSSSRFSVSFPNAAAADWGEGREGAVLGRVDRGAVSIRRQRP